MGCLASDRDGIMGGWSVAVIPCAAATCNITAVRPEQQSGQIIQSWERSEPRMMAHRLPPEDGR